MATARKVVVLKDGKTIRQSKNLRGILSYARGNGGGVSRVQLCHMIGAPGNYFLRVYYNDGAVGLSDFADWRVAATWVCARRSWDSPPVEGVVSFVDRVAEIRGEKP